MPVSTDQINVNWTLENLETRIKDNSEYINSLIGLIPPKYYFKNDPNNDETNSNTKINDEFQPNKRKRFSKQELKKQKKEAKKQKLDPNNLKTVLDIHKERLLNINQQKSSIDNDDDDDDDEEDDKEISEDDKEISEDDKEISDDNDDFDDDKSESEIDNEEKSNQSINQLQPKVQISTAERLARIRQVKESSSLQPSIKPNSKKSKQKRKSEEKKKKKQKSKINKQLKKESVNNNDNNNKEALHNDDDDIADDGNKKIKFAKFDFEQKNKKTKKQDNIHLINKLKKKSENFKKLERKDPEKAMIVKEKDAWNKVFQKAEGEKVKDDLKLLKKTVKRNAIKKKKSEKSWNERIETIAKNINEKQERRKSNIQARIEEKKKKKMKKRK